MVQIYFINKTDGTRYTSNFVNYPKGQGMKFGDVYPPTAPQGTNFKSSIWTGMFLHTPAHSSTSAVAQAWMVAYEIILNDPAPSETSGQGDVPTVELLPTFPVLAPAELGPGGLHGVLERPPAEDDKKKLRQKRKPRKGSTLRPRTDKTD